MDFIRDVSIPDIEENEVSTQDTELFCFHAVIKEIGDILLCGDGYLLSYKD